MEATTEPAQPEAAPLRFYHGWVNLVIASVAMSATLPGRTHGLGLITTPLTSEEGLGVDLEAFRVLNFWAILLGSALCLPVGRLIDRFGVRGVLVGVSLGLGLAVLDMSLARNAWVLFIALTLVRGLGQGALSVVSMAMVGKWFTRRLGLAMGVYTVLLSVGFIATTLGAGLAVEELGWRAAWAWVGCLILGLAPLGALLVRSTPRSAEFQAEEKAVPFDVPPLQALSSPAFWSFTLGAALFNFMWSAITLNNEDLLKARGFNHHDFLTIMGVLVASGLPVNLLAGWLAGRWPIGRVLAIGMAIFAASLLSFPFLRTVPQLVAYAAALGAAGGIITVVFFAAYGHAFGRRHLGVIQAAVQVVSVFASALGPVALTYAKRWGGSEDVLFYWAAPLAVACGVLAWLAPLPRRQERSV